jgi:FAD/FMN-containing dehydrogenase
MTELRTARNSTADSPLDSFEGHLIGPQDAAYDELRAVWNGMHDRRPALIARCAGAADVSRVLRYAAAADLRVTVRGGGHNVAGTAVADHTVMIDLSLLRRVDVDPDAGTAEAGGGALLRDLDAATLTHGLACPAGVVSHTGLGGLALGGGYGWLARRWGLTCDHILAAEVVLADGTIVQATEDEHADLLWGLRGGGGNLGVVTRFTLRLRRVDPFLYRQVAVFGLADAAAALDGYRLFAERQDRDLHAVGALKRAGHQSWIPTALRGEPALFLTTIRLGDPADGPSRTAPLLAHTTPAGVLEGPISYAELQAMGDHSEPNGRRYFTKSCYLTQLSAGPIAELVEATREMPSPLSSIDFEFLGGAIQEVPDEASAFPGRGAPYMCTVSAHWEDDADDADNIAWSRRGVDRLAAWQYGGAYVNYLQDERPDRVREIYGARYERLAAVKGRYDPLNIFSANQNVHPAPHSPL